MDNLMLTPEERKLRDLLWATHLCSGKYCDDGEIQCGVYLPPIDFLRDTPEEIEAKIPLHNAQLAKAESLIRKDERERIIDFIEEFELFTKYSGDFRSILVSELKERALKGG